MADLKAFRPSRHTTPHRTADFAALRKGAGHPRHPFGRKIPHGTDARIRPEPDGTQKLIPPTPLRQTTQFPLIFKSSIQGTLKKLSLEILQAAETEGKLPQRFSLAKREVPSRRKVAVR